MATPATMPEVIAHHGRHPMPRAKAMIAVSSARRTAAMTVA